MALRFLTLDRLLLWTGCGILVTFFLPLVLVTLWQLPQQQEKALIDKSRSFADQLAQSIVDPMLTENTYVTSRILQKAVENTDLYLYAVLSNHHNQIVTHTFEQGIPTKLLQLIQSSREGALRLRSPEGPFFNMTIPIMSGQLGYLHLGVSRQEVLEAQLKVVWTALATLAIALLILVTGTRFIAIYISRPLSKLNERTRSNLPTKGDNPLSSNIAGTAEVRNITARFLNLLHYLETIEKILTPSQKKAYRDRRSNIVSEILPHSRQGSQPKNEDIWSDAHLEARFFGLVFYRWIAITCIALTWLVYQALLQRYLFIQSMLIIILVMTTWNGFLELRKWWPKILVKRSVRFWLIVQIISDLLVLTLLLHIFGGIENPFKVLYVLLVVIAAMMFSIRVSSLIAIVGSLLYGGIIFAELMLWLPHHSLLLSGPPGVPGAWNMPYIVLGDGMGMMLVQIGVVFFIQTVSKKRNEAESARKEAEAVALSRERMAILGELAAGVAHEIRNPIHGLLNCCALLQKKNSSDGEVKELTMLLDEGLRRINTISDRLLRIGHARVVEKGPVNLHNMVNETVDLIRETARRKGVIIQIDVSGIFPLFWGNADRLSEALLNLLTNSLDASTQGGTIHIHLIREEEIEGIIKLVVKDTGEGISPEVLSKIFNPFFTTKAVGQGSGLGLSLVDETVRFHGGSVEAISSQGEGTTMTIYLPLGHECADSGREAL